MSTSTIRVYRVGGVAFALELRSPWIPMEYTEPVRKRIALAAAGDVLPVLPVRAGDKVPFRTFVQGRGELIPDIDANMLDLSMLEPFFIGQEADVTFRLVIHAPESEPFDAGAGEGLIMDVKDSQPYFKVYRRPEGTWFEVSTESSPSLGRLLVSNDSTVGDYYPEPGMTAYKVTYMMDVLLRMMFSYNSPAHSVLLMHSSVVSLDGEAVMFLGPSGTGKSTHSRLWLENISGTMLVNDDNPVVRLEDGKLFVYGTPWSGKTPCYRNVRVPVKAIVCLRQAPLNSISRLNGLYAYAGFVSAVSSVRWERRIMDALTPVASGIATSVPIYSMGCRPDAEAARVCRDGVWK